MAKFKCKKCKSTLNLTSHTIKFVKDKVVSPEATCCDDYMEEIKEEGRGLGSIIKRPGGRIRGKF